jgi:hypothetical protein
MSVIKDESDFSSIKLHTTLYIVLKKVPGNNLVPDAYPDPERLFRTEYGSN